MSKVEDCRLDGNGHLALIGEDIAEAANLGAHAAQLFLNVFIAAVHVVNAVENGLTVGDEGGQNQRG